MESYIASKENEKLLKVYLLKSAYEFTKGLDKEVSAALVSSCLVVRRNKAKN